MPALPQTVVELLQALIQIPSVNPAGNPGTTETGEARCAEYIAGFLRAIGAEVTVPEVLSGRPNVVGRFPGRKGRPRLLFAPHTDTVSVAGMTIAPFGGELRDGKIWGRGASDTKGSAAAMLWALRENADALAEAPYEIWFAGLAGEEAGQQGAKALAAAEPFDFVIAGEPTNMDVVHTHKGSAQFCLTTRGKAVHASQPEAGRNAISAMTPLLQLLDAEIRPMLRERYTHPVLGHSTLSIGTIEGGSKTNIVPDLCVAAVDLRTVPGQTDDPEFFADLERRFKSVCPGVEVEFIPVSPLYTDPSHPLIRQLQQQGAQTVGAPWFCDAAIFAQRGVPAIAMGPGSIAQAHTNDEFISVTDLEKGVDGFIRFLRALE